MKYAEGHQKPQFSLLPLFPLFTSSNLRQTFLRLDRFLRPFKKNIFYFHYSIWLMWEFWCLQILQILRKIHFCVTIIMMRSSDDDTAEQNFNPKLPLEFKCMACCLIAVLSLFVHFHSIYLCISIFFKSPYFHSKFFLFCLSWITWCVA